MSKGNGRSELCDYEHEMSILTQLDEAEKTIEAQRQEIEQLQAQAARMRDTLVFIHDEADLDSCKDEVRVKTAIREALKAIDGGVK
jgi:predicted RNase H-like nuclease (RuvC/YqgF family)